MMHSCSVSDISPSSVQGKSAIADRQYGRHSGAAQRNSESSLPRLSDITPNTPVSALRSMPAIWIPGSAARPRNDGTNVHVICSYIAKGFALGRV